MGSPENKLPNFELEQEKMRALLKCLETSDLNVYGWTDTDYAYLFTSKWLIHVQKLENKCFVRSCQNYEAVKPYFIHETLEKEELLAKVKTGVEFLGYFTHENSPTGLCEFELNRRNIEQRKLREIKGINGSR